MNIEKYLKDNLILIVPQNIKKKVIKYINSLDKMYNTKILSFNEFKKNYLFDYDTKTINYVMKKLNVSFKNAEEYLDNMYYIFDEDYIIPKLNELKNFKKELITNELLTINNHFIENLKNKEIIFWGFDHFDKYKEKILNNLNKLTKVENIYKDYNEYSPIIFSFKTLNEEIEYIANDIISKKLDLNHVFLAGINSDNESTLKRVFNNYHLNINLDSNTTLYETKVGLDFLENLDNQEKFLENIKDSKIKDIIINILNKYYWIDNKNEIKEMLIHDFKNTKIPAVKYQNAVNKIELKDNIINDDDYIYLINFNREYIPKTFKDEDFINDNEKTSYLEKTFEKNIIEKNNWKKILGNIKNLTITFSEQNLKGSLSSSPLISDNNYKVLNVYYKASNFSNSSNLYNLGILLDDYFKYGTNNEEIKPLLGTYPDHNYLKYDNSFSNLTYQNNKFNLSYSKMNSYFECPFKYYCDHILKLSPYEEKFDTWLGSLCHYILSKIYEADFDFNLAKDEFILNNNFELTKENQTFLNKILHELEEAIVFIKSLSKKSKYQNIECEKNIQTTFDEVTFTGIIDKIMHYQDNIVLIDYKTGTPDIDLRLANYGLNLQLPTYIYLIKSVYPNSNIVGIYLQHISKAIYNHEEDKTEKEQFEKTLKLTGYTLGNENYISDFDETYEDSQFIKGMKLTSNGFSKNTKLLTKDNFKNLELLTKQKIEECINGIKKGNFKIAPKIVGQNNISCSFCPYKSVCFVKEQDKKYIYLDNELSFLGGENND